MIDFHNHILPGVDDGAKTIEEAIEMLKHAMKQGITDVVSTVHFQHPKMEHKNLKYDFLKKKINILQEAIGKNNIKLHLGAEVFYLPNLVNLKKNKLTVFNHGYYMLIEFYPFHLPPNMFEILYELKISGTTPIIAHPERNKIVQMNIKIIEKLINAGCLIQADAGSILGHFGKKCKKTVNIMLNRHMIHIIGSDAHNNQKRNFCLLPAFEEAIEIMGENAKVLVKDNPKKILKGLEIKPFSIIEENKKNFYVKFLDFIS